MRRSSITLFALTLLAVATPSLAKMPFVKKAQDLGIAEVKNCASCHDGAPKKDGKLTDMGAFLMKTKAEKKAAEVDVAWLKGYKAKK